MYAPNPEGFRKHRFRTYVRHEPEAPMKILVADDDELARVGLSLTLKKWGYEVITCGDGRQALAHLNDPDGAQIAILDWMMPEIDGPEVCQLVREHNIEAYRYLILLTSRDSKDDVIAGLSAGADDYLVKPFNPMELKVRIRAGRRIIDLQNELIQARNILRTNATTDSLTGVWNRLKTMESLNVELTRARREGTSVGVMMLDIDFFKQVNDTFGHLTGDAVLRETASRMRELLRPYDFIGRFGGEEFIVVVPGVTAQEAMVQGERLRMAVGATTIDTADGFVGVTISVGVSLFEPSRDGGLALEGVLEQADQALYASKANGRDRVTLYEPTPAGNA
ncbi:MAG: diguanylate cyclase [Nitrospinae bacterium]|nr:diguanylate cyclase [Nitrospinota bacterium]